MKITKIELFRINIPMTGNFKNSSYDVREKPTILVKMTTDNGIISWGETPGFLYPFYKMDTISISWLAMQEYLIPFVLQKEFKKTEDLVLALRTIKGCNFAKTGIENAFVAARAIEENISLKRLIGGVKDKIPVGETIFIKNSIKEMLSEIELRLEQGFQRVKVKIKPGWDKNIIKAVRKSFGTIPLMVDANSSYMAEDITKLKELDAYALMMIEQPFAADNIVSHAVLQKESRTPVCLDESILSWNDAATVCEMNACTVINIKPVRVGGAWESKLIHDYCETHGMGVWCGGMGETTLGRAFNIALSSLPNYIYPADMSPVSFIYQDDITTETFSVDRKGFIQVPDEVGIGFTVNEKKVKKYTERYAEFF